MKEIPLTQGMVAQVDDTDYEWLSRWSWYAHKNGRNFYAICNVKRAEGITSQYMHRLILNVPEGVETDHRDCNGLNNQRANLRLCTHQENLRNQKPGGRGFSPFKGVTWSKEAGKWQARIKVNNVARHLGFFKKDSEAAKAYNKVATELFGEFAKLNIISRKE